FDEKAAKEAKKNKDIEIRPIVTAEPDPERAAARDEERRSRRDRRDRKPRTERGERPERPEREAKPARSGAPKPAAPKAALEKRRESHAVNISEGEMADRLYADARAFLDPIFAKLGVSPEITPEVKEGILWLTVRGDDLGILIGRRGETLNSLQYLVNLAVNKRRHEHARLVLDVEGYREGREETLTALARKMAEKAVRSGRRVELEPMNPHERRVVYSALQEDKRVDTVSHGEEPYRRVVINPKNRKNRKGRGNKEAKNDNLAAEAEATLVMPAETAPETVTAVPAPELSPSDLSARIAAEVAALQAKAAEKPEAE
ncbi:MAG: KH domain-containing protein, partial [Firmicutes bacterium]|nr:KH domain-containing protein [Bacillota bacterium]